MNKIPSKPRVAVVGATGAVGREMISILEQREFPVASATAFASARSAGKTIPFRGELLTVKELTSESLYDFDLALFSAGGETSRVFAPIAAKAGCVVVDNSSAFRMDDDVPLIVPEVNPEALEGHSNIIANPNCSTIQMVVALAPLNRVSRIERIIVSTYQAVSGTGQAAIDELMSQAYTLQVGDDVTPQVYPKQIAYNVLPHIDDFLGSGFTKEEMKMVNETRKILNDQNIAVNATTVRVPVVRGHSESVYIETQTRIGAGKAREVLSAAEGIRLVDEPESGGYPVPLDCAGQDETLVGRVRDDLDTETGLSLWVVADNLRKGAALNAVQIAELLLDR